MPFLALVHLRELRCSECGVELASAGSRSFVVDASGLPANFPEDGGPEDMTVVIHCRNGHETELYVPNEIAAEDVASTPDDAPVGVDAVLLPNVP
jgi:hypothetical protein